MRLPLGASVDAGPGRLVVMPDLDDVAIWVAEICGAFRQALGPVRVLTSWHEIYCLSNQSSCERCIISGVHGQTDVIDWPPAGIATGKVFTSVTAFLSIRSSIVMSLTRTLGNGAVRSSNSCFRTGRKPTTSPRKPRESFGLSTQGTTWSMFTMSVYHCTWCDPLLYSP